jgi:hypothetical protein
LISAAHDGEQEGGGEEREDHPRPHEAAAQPQVHQLQQCGAAICMYQFLDLHLPVM